jgi:serine/threonine-protein phosphatase 6 regulatory subunit 3
MPDDTDGSGAFDNFGDFGDFQSGDGDLTPTGGSWTFASDASFGSGSDEVEILVDEFNGSSGSSGSGSGSGTLSSSPTNARGRAEPHAQISGFSNSHT